MPEKQQKMTVACIKQIIAQHILKKNMRAYLVVDSSERKYCVVLKISEKFIFFWSTLVTRISTFSHIIFVCKHKVYSSITVSAIIPLYCNTWMPQSQECSSITNTLPTRCSENSAVFLSNSLLGWLDMNCRPNKSQMQLIIAWEINFSQYKGDGEYSCDLCSLTREKYHVFQRVLNSLIWQSLLVLTNNLVEQCFTYYFTDQSLL